MQRMSKFRKKIGKSNDFAKRNFVLGTLFFQSINRFACLFYNLKSLARWNQRNTILSFAWKKKKTNETLPKYIWTYDMNVFEQTQRSDCRYISFSSVSNFLFHFWLIFFCLMKSVAVTYCDKWAAKLTKNQLQNHFNRISFIPSRQLTNSYFNDKNEFKTAYLNIFD